jgi:Bacteriophage replication gene A protein (GPA)
MPFAAFDEHSAEAQAELAALELQLRKINICGIHASHRQGILWLYPTGLRIALARRYLDTATTTRLVLKGEERRQAILEGRGVDSWAQANIDLTSIHQRLQGAKAHLAWSNAEVCEKAENCADACATFARGLAPNVAYRVVSSIAERHGVKIPQPTHGKTVAGCVARLCDPRWWRRAIRASYARIAEDIERELGLVCRQKGIYASDDCVERRRQQRARNRNMLEAMIAVNELGECFTVAELSDRNTSNPSVRRAELMTRIRGFEEHAKHAGDVGHFITATLPSRFHCVHHESGTRNAKFDGSTIRDGQRYLCRQWARLRSRLDRLGISPYGFRIAEPHHDGTVHWHLLIFVEPSKSDAMIAAFKNYLNPEGEPGDRRVDVKALDLVNGSAAGYVAKYVSKNIDGFGVGDDAEATGAKRDATETAKRVDAWASTAGLRQFQQIGGPPVSVWRELRRMKAGSTGAIEEARQAAEDQAWDRFCVVMGGMTCRAGDRPVRLHTGRGAKPGRYGEPIERQIKGIRSGAVIVPTRLHNWTFVRNPVPVFPWTRVNNCTGGGASAGADRCGSGLDCGSTGAAPEREHRCPGVQGESTAVPWSVGTGLDANLDGGGRI